MKRTFRLVMLLATVFAAVRLAAEPAELASLRAKAEKGNSLAQYNLGLAYAEGQQVPADLPQAFMWLSLAAENGSTGKALESVLGNITDAQLEEGRRLVAANRAAYAPPAPTPTMSRSTFRKLNNRGFTIGPRTDAVETKTAQPTVPPKPSASVHASDPIASDAEQLLRMKQENAQLRTELVQATNKLEEQAEAIARLQGQLSAKQQTTLTAASAQPNHAATGLVAGGPLH